MSRHLLTCDRSRFLVAIAALLLAGCSALPSSAPASPQRAYDAPYSLEFLVGARTYDEADFAPIEDQVGYALQLDSQVPGYWMGWELGLSYSSDSDDVFVPGLGTLDVGTDVFEFYGGLRKEFETGGPLRPYLGVGASLVDLEIDASVGGMSGSESDSSLGLYVHGGLLVDVTDHLYAGIDARAVLATDFDIAGVGLDADHEQFAAVLGFSL